MAPKFKGGSEDWLDDEAENAAGREARSAGRKKSVAARSLSLDWAEANATVSEVYPKLCQVRFDEDQTRVLCAYRRAEVVSKGVEGMRERTPVAVGERVRASKTSADAGVIDGICARQTQIVRAAPGNERAAEERRLVHVLAANVEVLLLVMSTRDPEFVPGLVDRFWIAAQVGGAELRLCVTKADLADAKKPWALYQPLGLPVFEVSVRSGQGVEELRTGLLGRSVLFSGQSGVGKTSLLKKLTGHDVGRIGDVNATTGKGKHTTTSSRMIDGPEGARWFDTPGIRELGLVGVTAETVRDCFVEFVALPCQARGCMHRGEQGCDAVALPRHESYLRIVESLK